MDQSSMAKYLRRRSNEGRDQRSITKRIMQDDELREMLQEELDSTGVVTAVGYQAVLQKFLLSEAVSNKLGIDGNDKSEMGNSSAERRLSRMHTMGSEMTQSTRPSLTGSLSSAYGQFEPENAVGNNSSECDEYFFGESQTTENGRSLLGRFSMSSSALQSSLSSFLNAASKIAPRLEDELDVKKKKKVPKKKNLAPFKGSIIVPCDVPPIMEKSCVDSMERRPALSHYVGSDRSLVLGDVFDDSHFK